jgi:hypothetical protein
VLVHFPIYARPSDVDGHVEYMIELLLASLHSYFCHGNSHDVLVSTNDSRVFDVVSIYRARAGRRFELLKVSDDDLMTTFGVGRELLADERVYRITFPKFYPVLRRLADRIVHIDFDTMFLSKVDFRPLFVSGLGLIDSNRVGRRPPYWPPSSAARFFRLSRSLRPVSSWINCGVFGVQSRGVDLCRNEFKYYFRNFDRVRASGIDVNADETIMNALAIRERGVVSVIRDFTLNLLAYYVKFVPDWPTRAQILHFHGIKPHVFYCMHGRIHCNETPPNLPRIGEPFYRAALRWLLTFHAATRDMGIEFARHRAMPLELVNRELARLDGNFREPPSEADLSARGAGSSIVQGPIFEHESCAPFEDKPEARQPEQRTLFGKQRSLVGARRTWAG